MVRGRGGKKERAFEEKEKSLQGEEKCESRGRRACLVTFPFLLTLSFHVTGDKEHEEKVNQSPTSAQLPVSVFTQGAYFHFLMCLLISSR